MTGSIFLPDSFTESSVDADAEARRLAALRSYEIVGTAPEAAFDRITALAARLFDAPMSVMSLIDADRQWIKSCIGGACGETARDVAFCSYTIREKEVLVVPDTTRDERFASSEFVTADPFIRFYAGAPLVDKNGHILGALCVMDSQPREFDAAAARTLSDLAEIVVDELERRISNQRLQEESEARHDTQKALDDSQARFESAFYMSANGMALLSPIGNWLQVNERMCQILGYSEAELLATSFQNVTFPEDLDADLELVRQILAGEIASYNLEKRYIRADGEIIWGWLSVSLIRDERGRPSYFVSQVQDISKRKRMEEDLRESEALKTAVVETALDCIITIDIDGSVGEWNPAAEKTFGYTRQEALGKKLHDLIIPPELRDAHQAGLKHWSETGFGPILGKRIELPAVRADGSGLTIELAAVAIPGTNPPIFTGHLRDISERKRVEERLRLLESVSVNANDSVLITEAGSIDEPGPRIIYANQAFLSMTGYDLEEVVGRSPRFLQGPGTDAETRTRIRLALQRVRPIREEILNYAKDGTPYWVELSMTPILNESGAYTHWVSIQRDITERRKTLDALRNSERRYHDIAANVPGMVYRLVLKPDGTFSFPFVSDGCREIYHLEREPILQDARVIISCVHPEHAESFYSSIMNSAQTLEPWEWEGRILLADGIIKWVRGTSRATREPDGSTVWDGIIFDFTQRRGAEDQLRSARLEAESAREEAERANLAKSDFLSRMSHELRTPLNAILGFGQLLEMSNLDAQDMESAQQIIKAGRHLLALINEVLDIARIESGKLAISSETVDAGEIALEVLDLVRPLAAKRSIVINDQQARDCRLFVTADRQRLKQILVNLASNAVKYNRQGGTITFSIQEFDDSVRLSVSDTGPGIAPENLDRIWLPFERLGAETTGIEGTGVGLAVSQGLAKAMVATLRVQSEVGRGSDFSIDLPRAENPGIIHEAENENEIASVSSTKYVVLYIEDNPSNLQLVQRILARRPEIRLLSAMQGELGYELARLHSPDLILLDLHLPDVSGKDVLLRLQANEATRAIPVVVLTADATPGQSRRAIEAGARAYLTKPLEMRQFFDTIDDILISDEEEEGKRLAV